MSQLDDLVTAVAARVNDATVLFEAGKLKINQHAQRRHAVFVRASGVLKPSAAPKRAPFGVPVSGVGTTEYVRFTREELVQLTLSAESEDALDTLFDVVANAIFDIGGPNVLVEDSQPYDWVGGDSDNAANFTARVPKLVFVFKMRIVSHPHTKPFAVVATALSTVTELSGSQAITVPTP
jgi:hypothetical protein